MLSEDGGLDKVESLEVESGEDLDEEPSELEVHEGRHEPGADFSKATGKVDAEDFYDEIDTTNNQSLVPSSFGMTFCVDGEQEEILLDVSWGRYERTEDQEITISDKEKDPSKENKIKKLKVWERLPCGGKLKIPLVSGPIKPLIVDSTNLGVIVQGNVREKNETGSRLVTVFLVNAQTEPFEQGHFMDFPTFYQS